MVYLLTFAAIAKVTDTEYRSRGMWILNPPYSLSYKLIKSVLQYKERRTKPTKLNLFVLAGQLLIR